VQDYVGCYATEVSNAGWFEVFGIFNMFHLFEISEWCGRDVELFCRCIKLSAHVIEQ